MQHKRLQGLCTKSQWYSQTEVNDMLNRCDFRCVLKTENVRDRRRSTGKLFQARGSATARSRSPLHRLVAGNRTSAVDAERSRRRESTSDSGWINSDRYCGAAPFKQRCTNWKWNIHLSRAARCVVITTYCMYLQTFKLILLIRQRQPILNMLFTISCQAELNTHINCDLRLFSDC